MFFTSSIKWEDVSMPLSKVSVSFLDHGVSVTIDVFTSDSHFVESSKLSSFLFVSEFVRSVELDAEFNSFIVEYGFETFLFLRIELVGVKSKMPLMSRLLIFSSRCKSGSRSSFHDSLTKIKRMSSQNFSSC